ncbi:MAG: pyridoxamine 5'-phosphate oxidase family protein [Clostridiales bacterium]|nr:pyridoxamine 5'-phosphate oxidase family protein [Clostridiales bacterium]
MRRKDREVASPDRIREIISACHCCRLGFCDHGKVYIVPLNFGFSESDGKYSFYFHGAKEGRKADLIREYHYAGFEMDTNYRLNEGEEACGYSARFQSVIGSGKVDFIEDEAEKEKALQVIMCHNTGKSGWTFSEEALRHVGVFRLEAEELSCKEHL